MSKSARREKARRAVPVRTWLRKRNEEAVEVGKLTGMMSDNSRDHVEQAMKHVCDEWLGKLTAVQKVILNDLYAGKQISWAQMFIWKQEAWHALRLPLLPLVKREPLNQRRR